MRFRHLAAGIALSVLALGCSHAKITTPELSKMEGKKVALIEIDGESTARRVCEVALINQLVKRGTFILVSREEVEKARTAFNTNSADWEAIGKAAGAEYAIRARVLEFAADEHEGYSSETVKDSQMEAETGEAETENVYKVKSLEGRVRVQMDFSSLTEKDLRSGVAEATDKVVAEQKTQRAELPPKLRFLENISNEAFKKFFDRYN